MPPRYARGRRPVPSPRAQAVGTQGGKKSLQARFFAAASPAVSALAGFPPKRLTRVSCSCRNIKLCALYTFWDSTQKMKELALQRSTCVGPAKSRGGRAVNANLLSGSCKTACR